MNSVQKLQHSRNQAPPRLLLPLTGFIGPICQLNLKDLTGLAVPFNLITYFQGLTLGNHFALPDNLHREASM